MPRFYNKLNKNVSGMKLKFAVIDIDDTLCSLIVIKTDYSVHC